MEPEVVSPVHGAHAGFRTPLPAGTFEIRHVEPSRPIIRRYRVQTGNSIPSIRAGAFHTEFEALRIRVSDRLIDVNVPRHVEAGLPRDQPGRRPQVHSPHERQDGGDETPVSSPHAVQGTRPPGARQATESAPCGFVDAAEAVRPEFAPRVGERGGLEATARRCSDGPQPRSVSRVGQCALPPEVQSRP